MRHYCNMSPTPFLGLQIYSQISLLWLQCRSRLAFNFVVPAINCAVLPSANGLLPGQGRRRFWANGGGHQQRDPRQAAEERSHGKTCGRGVCVRSGGGGGTEYGRAVKTACVEMADEDMDMDGNNNGEGRRRIGVVDLYYPRSVAPVMGGAALQRHSM